MAEEEKDTKLEALHWALEFMRQYEKKLLNRAIKIAHNKRKDLQKGLRENGIIR